MTTSEFSAEFDILYNNISSNQAPGLTEYEKSVFLTKAQDEIIKNHFTNKPGGNKYQEGIEDSSKRFADFSCLITVVKLNQEARKSDDITYGIYNGAIDQRGIIFKIPNDLMLTLNETFYTKKDTVEPVKYQVVPINLQEYQRLMSRPSTDPLKNQVWKLMGNSTSGNGSIEIIPHWIDAKENTTLVVRYIRHPYPIILENLEYQELSINGKTQPYNTEGECCELSKELHPEILQRAVELAKIYYQGAPADVMTAGQRSE